MLGNLVLFYLVDSSNIAASVDAGILNYKKKYLQNTFII